MEGNARPPAGAISTGSERHVGAAEDGALALRIIAGGAAAPEAERELCRRFAPRIRLYGLRHLRDEAAAADLVQEVLVLTLERLRSGAVREPERIASFVLGACRLSARDARKREARHAALLERHLDREAMQDAGDPLSVDAARLQDCLDALGQRERAVLTLTFCADLDAGHIAVELDVSPGNVRVIRHRAMARLRGCMGFATPEERS